MKTRETPIGGVFEAEPDLRVTDERGSFSRLWTTEGLKQLGLEIRDFECSISFNHSKGTLRGLHYQRAPHLETKIVQCIAGAAFDVVLDLRPDSPSFGRWHGLELSESNRSMVIIPPGVAHGFQTLRDSTELLYQIMGQYVEDAACGVRWDDPAFGIEWPMSEGLVISRRDAGFADFRR